MAIIYTDNLHLGMQLDKTDYFSMDNINENWQKIDALALTGGVPENSLVLSNSVPIPSAPEIIVESE